LLVRGMRVQVLTRRQPRNLPQHDQLEGVSVMRYPVHLGKDTIRQRPMTRFMYRVHVLLTFLRLAQAIRAARPDVVHVHYPYDETLLIHLLRRFCPFRLVVTVHGNELGRPGHPASALYLYWLRSLLLAADAVTACSASLLAELKNVVPEIESKSCVIHNSVDTTRFTEHFRYQHPRPYIFAAGRLASEKGFDLLLDAYACSIAKDTDLLIAGAGEVAESLRRQTARLGIERQVRWLGQRDASEIAGLMGGCEFVVTPSRAEAFGLTALEAMAAGKRVLATQVGGLPELVPEPPNRLVAPTVEAIARGLQTLWSESAETAQIAATVNRKHADRFGVEAMAAQYLATYVG